MPGFFASFPSGSSGAAGVSSLNTMTGDLTLIGGAGITVTDGSGTITISASGGPFANTFLSNLDTPTAINQDLLPVSNNAVALGAAGNSFNTAFIATIADTTGTPAIFPQSRQLINATSTLMLDWSTAGALTVNSAILPQVANSFSLGSAPLPFTALYTGNIFFPDNSLITSSVLADTATLASVSWSNRQLIANDGATMAIDWSTPGTVLINNALKTASTSTGNTPSQALTLASGNTTGTGGGSLSGAVSIATGTTTAANSAAVSGAINLTTGDTLSTSGGNTGAIALTTGHPHSSTRQSGAISLTTGLTVNHSGNIALTTGNSSGSASGNITLLVGTASTTRGLIQLQNGTESAIGQVWSSTDTVGSGGWSNLLIDATSLTALNWSTRQLIANNGTTVALDWSIPGTVSVNTSTISNVVDPVNPQDAATKNYVDSAGTGANTALSNLAAVAINASLLPGTTDAIDLGSTSKLMRDIFVGSADQGIALINSGSLVTTATMYPIATTPSGVSNVPAFSATAGGTNFNIGMFTQSSSAANAAATGDVLIETGNKVAGTGNSGNIKMTFGTSSGGTVGTLKLANATSTTGAQTATFTNVPGAVGPKNPTGYLTISINGTTSYIPYFQ